MLVDFTRGVKAGFDRDACFRLSALRELIYTRI